MKNVNQDNIVDLTCKGCGQTMKAQKHSGVTVTKLASGGLMYTSNDEPFTFTCPYCGKSFATWKPGPKTEQNLSSSGFSGAIAQGNGAVAVGAGGIMIMGNLGKGNHIIAGNNNYVSTSSTDDDDDF